MKVALYLRVSTSKQDSSNQQRELVRVAEARGWTVTREYTDDGISGAKTRQDRPALDQMLKDAAKGRFDLIAVWSIDRLSRSLVDLITTVNEIRAFGCDLFVFQQNLDTSSPAGKLAFSVFGALAEYERELIRERVRIGLDRAKANGTKLGRPSNMNDGLRAAIVALRNKGQSIRQISAGLGVGVGSVYRVLQAAGLAADTKVAA